MTMTDPVADMLTRLRNANVAMHDEVRMPSSKLKEALAALLVKEGYIGRFEVHDDPNRPDKSLVIELKYSPDRELRRGKPEEQEVKLIASCHQRPDPRRERATC